MRGAELSRVRKELGMTVYDLADAVSAKPGAVYALEKGKPTRNPEALEARVDEWLEVHLRAEMLERPLPKMSAAPGWTVTTEWNGLTPGATCHVEGAEGMYRFLRHVASDKGGVWVDVIGGLPDETRFRAFSPERIRP